MNRTCEILAMGLVGDSVGWMTCAIFIKAQEIIIPGYIKLCTKILEVYMYNQKINLFTKLHN
jgi:hypothetical protein